MRMKSEWSAAGDKNNKKMKVANVSIRILL